MRSRNWLNILADIKRIIHSIVFIWKHQPLINTVYMYNGFKVNLKRAIRNKENKIHESCSAVAYFSSAADIESGAYPMPSHPSSVCPSINLFWKSNKLPQFSSDLSDI